jgi:hypothetical protein
MLSGWSRIPLPQERNRHILSDQRTHGFYHDNWAQRTGAPTPVAGLPSMVTPVA